MRMLDKAVCGFHRCSGVRSSEVNCELEAELRFHLDQLIEENISSGMPPETLRQLRRTTITGVLVVLGFYLNDSL